MEAVLTGPAGRTLLGSREVTIGCDADNTLVVADLRTAAHHALVRPDGLGYAVIDLGSEYGTIVNGRWLEQNKMRPLLPGDVIQIGTTNLTFEVFPSPAAIPTGMLGVGVGNPTGIAKVREMDGQGGENVPVSAPPPTLHTLSTDIADQDTVSFNKSPDDARLAARAASPKFDISSLRSLLNKTQPEQPPYTSQPWIPDGITTYPPQQQLWQQDRRRLYIVLLAMLVILIISSLIALIASRPTPDKTLDTFCNALLAGNGQLAENQLSTRLQNEQGSSLIALLVTNKITACRHTSAISNGSSATATLFVTSPSNSGATNLQGKSLVTLIQEASGAWRIDALQSQ